MIQRAQRKTIGATAKLLAVLAVLGLALTACSGGERTESVFTISQSGMDITLTYYATGDEVTRRTGESVMLYETLQVENQEEAEAMIGPMAEDLQGITGVDHSVEYTEDAAIERMDIDFAKASAEDVQRVTGGMVVEKDGKVSLEQSREILVEAGFTEVESKPVE